LVQAAEQDSRNDGRAQDSIWAKGQKGMGPGQAQWSLGLILSGERSFHRQKRRDYVHS
jgi:hypothetical protein